MRNLVLLLLFLVVSSVKAQTIENRSQLFQYKNNFHLELMGNGAYYSFNYERILINKEKFKTTGQLGLSYIPMADWLIDQERFWIFPLSINEIYSIKNNHIEVGLGVTIINNKWTNGPDNVYNEWDIHNTARIGYRYQKPEGKFIFRASYTPFYSIGSYGFSILHWGGLSFGYAFK